MTGIGAYLHEFLSLLLTKIESFLNSFAWKPIP